MNNIIANPTTLEAIIKRSDYTSRFKEVLGERAPMFMSSVLALGRSMPDVEPKSIVAAAWQAALLNLPVDKNLGLAWIVPYRQGREKLAQFQLGARGIIQLALRSGCYAAMNACAVNKEVFRGYTSLGHAQLDWSQYDPEKPVVGYAFAFALVNSPNYAWTFYWTKQRVETHARKFSQAYRSGSGPWRDHFDRMALKTVVKNELAHWGILSIDFQRGLIVDQSVMKDLDSEPMPEQEVPELITGGGAQGAAEILADSNADDGDLAPQKSKEPVRENVAAPVATEVNPRRELENFVISNGFTFDAFKRWCASSGMVPDIDSVSGFMEIDEKIASRVLRAKTGLLRGLEQFR